MTSLPTQPQLEKSLPASFARLSRSLVVWSEGGGERRVRFTGMASEGSELQISHELRLENSQLLFSMQDSMEQI